MEELINFLVRILNEFLNFLIGDILVDVCFLDGFEKRLYGEDLEILIFIFVVGLNWKFCVYLENLEDEFVFCFFVDFWLWFERFDSDCERDFVIGFEIFCDLCIKLDDLKNDLMDDIGFEVVVIEGVLVGWELFEFIMGIWLDVNEEDLKRDLIDIFGLFVLVVCWDEFGRFGFFFEGFKVLDFVLDFELDNGSLIKEDWLER